MDKIEVWKNVPNYLGYQVSSFGRVKSLQRIEIGRDGKKRTIKYKMLAIEVTDQGYHRVGLTANGVFKRIKVHQLVAMAFLGHTPCGNYMVVNHKNFIRSDNRLDNLEIVTNRENCNKSHIKSASQFVGVTERKTDGKWIARIRVNDIRVNLGAFDNESEAGLYYKNAVISIERGEPIERKIRYNKNGQQRKLKDIAL